jgi:hypothetical protein
MKKTVTTLYCDICGKNTEKVAKENNYETAEYTIHITGSVGAGAGGYSPDDKYSDVCFDCTKAVKECIENLKSDQ